MTTIKQLIILALWTSPLLGLAQPASKDSSQNVLLVSATSDFELTGDGRSSLWSQTDWIPLPLRNKPKSDYPTQVKLLYSQTGIYLLYSCTDRKITATLKADFADLFREDVVEAFFWPDESVPVYFEYELSPLNYELAILVPNMNGSAFGWKPWHYEGGRLTRHATHVHEDGKGVQSWTAEIFIPYALLSPIVKTAPRKGTRWRANLYRIDYDEGTSYFMWQPTNNNFHEFKKYGTVQFD